MVDKYEDLSIKHYGKCNVKLFGYLGCVKHVLGSNLKYVTEYLFYDLCIATYS